jgi:hypothetical protein
VTPTLFGMHGFGPWSLAAMRASVGTFRSSSSNWQLVEPEHDRWFFSDVDGDLRNAYVRGVHDVLFQLTGTPAWARGSNRSSDSTSPGSANPPRDIRDWDAFVATFAQHVEAVARLYPGLTVSYQVWNEANLTTFWNGSPALMATMTARAYRIIKSVNPAAHVAAASTTMRIPADYARFFPAYLRALSQQRPAWPVDAFSIHGYPPGTGNPLTYQSYLRKAKASLAAAHAPARPLWVTEINYGLRGPGPSIPHRSITGATSAAWISRTYLDAMRFGVTRVYWYWQSQYDPLLGIQVWSGTSALIGERVTYSWLVGTTFRGCTASQALVSCTVTRGARSWIIAWSEAGPRALRVPATGGRRCDLTNRCLRVLPGRLTSVTSSPVRVGP